jgi:hypothetical protein
MKKLILLLAVAAFITQVKAQEVDTRDVPVVVITAFGTANPGMSSDVDWTREGDNYVAAYDMNHKDYFVVYDQSGTMVEKREKLSKNELPPSVLSYIRTNFKEDELRHATKITDANGHVTYKGKVKGQWLMFDQNGEYIMQSNKKL